MYNAKHRRRRRAVSTAAPELIAAFPEALSTRELTMTREALRPVASSTYLKL